MTDPPDGFLRPIGRRLGGHAYLYTRYSRKLDAVWTPNSWGGEGQGWTHRSDLIFHFSEGGEAAIPVLRKKPAGV